MTEQGRMEVLEGIFTSIIEMEQNEKIDPKVVGKLESFIDSIKQFENFWIENESLPLNKAFIAYHTTRNIRIILEKINSRINESIRAHENPEVIHEAMRVMPALVELYSVIEPFKGKPIPSKVFPYLSNRLQILRNLASEVSMLPSFEDEVKEADIEKLKKSFSSFAGLIQEKYREV